MGKALQLVSGYVTAPSTTYTAVTPSPNDLLAVNDYANGSQAWLVNAWLDCPTGGSLRMRSPNFHDDVNGIELVIPTAAPIALMNGYSVQRLQSNDTLTVEIKNTSSNAPAAGTMLHYYENLPGADAQLFPWEAIRGNIAELMTCRVSVNNSGTAGTYGGAAAMTALQNLFKANGYYALLGWTANKSLTSVGVTGTDTSNRRVGGPGTTPDVFDTREWFIEQSRQTGFPCIPVYKTQNLQSTVVDCIDIEGSGATIIEFLFARLTSPVTT